MLMAFFHHPVPLSETTNIDLLEQVVSDQRQILTNVFNGTNITTIPQVWTLCTSIHLHNYLQVLVEIFLTDKEVQGYYEDGMRVPDDVVLVWSDDKFVEFLILLESCLAYPRSLTFRQLGEYSAFPSAR